MEIIEMAAELGKLIKADDRMKRLDAATAKYETDTELLALIDKYNAFSAAMREQEQTANEQTMSALEEQLGAIYDEVMENPTMVEYVLAKQESDALMSEVSSEITFQITGKRPHKHDCHGDCDCCDGCDD